MQGVYVNGLTIYFMRALPCVRTQLDILLNCRAAERHSLPMNLSEEEIAVPWIASSQYIPEQHIQLLSAIEVWPSMVSESMPCHTGTKP